MIIARPFSQRTIPVFALMIILTVSCATVQKSAEPETQPSYVDSTAKTASLYQLKRPMPNPIDFETPHAYKRAIQNGTRTQNGQPGPNYWQQRADYDIEVELLPEEKQVVGRSTTTYHNNSPDTLRALVFELAQNVHTEGVPRNESVEITGGIDLKSITVDGNKLEEITRSGESGYVVDATRLIIVPGQPVAPGRSATIETAWSFLIPQAGAGGRMGYSDDNLFFIAYWFPQVMVYDDVFGWFADLFTNNAEFYHEFGDYKVNITAPEQWLITATGKFQNADEVLAAPVLERYQKAQESDSIVNIAGKDDFGKVTKTGQNGKITWSFQADNVNDFAFSATKASVWDGARTPVGDRDGDGQTDYIFTDALYRTSAPKWTEAARYAQHSITFLSNYTGISYPWPHMTSIEGGGIIGGGMEFPMMTLIGSYNFAPQNALYYVVAHELAHMWVPMIVSNNERRFSWMDEGTTTFNENQAKKDFFPESSNPDTGEFRSYLYNQGNQFAGSYFEGPIMRWSDYHYSTSGFSTASYSKPASGLIILRNLLGEDMFMKAYRTFLDRWKFKHPYPWDLFNTFEQISGRDLDWFWRSFYYETWVLDQAVGEVNTVENGTRIVIEDKGQMPMPAHIQVTFKDGRKITRSVDVGTWLNGATSAELVINEPSEVVRVEIDPEYHFPDINRFNNTWEK